MFQRIVVPLDGSERAGEAIPVAARIARASTGSIVLLSVQGPPIDFARQRQFASLSLEDRVAERKAMAVELARLAASEELKGITTVTEVIEGLPALTILERAQVQQADLIILCSHGRSGITRWAMGSVAQKVARHSTMPVLVLRTGWPMDMPDHGIRPLRVMVALDGSPLAESALLPAAQLSAALSAPRPGELHLVRVLPFSTAFDYGQEDDVAKLRQEKMQEARTYLQEVTQKLAEQSPDQVSMQVNTSVATSLDTAETLINIAETGDGEGMTRITSTCDVIALATHGRSGPARWVMGSITERILGATRLPLLIVRPRQIDDQPAEKKSAEQAF